MDMFNDSADVFANSSTETVAENIDYSLFLNNQNVNINSNYQLSVKPENNELVRITRPFCTSSPLAECSTMFSTSAMSNTSMYSSFVTNQFVTDACHAPVSLYCPFCPDEFKMEFLLKDHIKFAHPNELKTVIRRSYYENDNGVEFQPCPFCHAKFYVKELLPKHIVKKHQDSVMSMFTDVNPDRYVHCPFCNHKVLTRHSKLMINHIEKKHLIEFQFAINSKCSNMIMDPNSLSFFDYKANMTSNDCSSLSKKMMGLTTTSGSDIKQKGIKSILKKTTSYPDGLNLDDSVNDGHLNKSCDEKIALGLSTFSLNNSSVMERRSARRRLRFELPPPDSPPSDDENNKENCIFNPGKKRNFSSDKNKLRWLNLFRFNRNKKDKKKDTINNKKQKKQKISKHSPDKSHKQSPKLVGNYKEKEVQTTPVYSNVDFRNEGVAQLAVTQFKCGLCFEGFSKNALLLDHLRRNHKGLKLMPQYRCGECDAKFFRNSFLVRHCWFHHTPKCLKNGSNEALK